MTPSLRLPLAVTGLLLAAVVPAATAAPLLDAAYLRFATGPGPHTVATADMDGDGKPDLVVANSATSSLSVLLNQGEGRFTPPRDQACVGLPGDIATGDVNGDHRADVVVVYPSSTNAASNQFSVFIGSGDGGFAYGFLFAVPWGFHSVAVGDVNGDSVSDIVVTNEHNVSVFLGATSGIISSSGEFSTSSTPNSIYPVAAALGDLNGDGATDIALANNELFDRPCTVLPGHGDGTFGSPTRWGTGNLATSIATADLNADGHADLVLGVLEVVGGTSYPVLAVLLGDGSGTFLYQSYYPTGTRVTAVALADLDGNGRLDAAVATDSSSAASVLLGDGLGGFGPRGRLERGDGTTGVVAADLNGDGRLDLAASERVSGGATVSLGNGDGTFGGDHHEAAVAASPREVALGDFDRDGQLDLAVACDAAVSVALGIGHGVFEPSSFYPVLNGSTSIAVGDVNGDGVLDLAVTSAIANKASVLLGVGDGTFGPRSDYDTSLGTNPSTGLPYAVTGDAALADLDHDGRSDLVVVNRGQGQHGSSTPGAVSVLLAQADGTLGPRHDFQTGYGTSSVAVGNLDSDTHPDVAVVNSVDGVVAVYWGNGLGDFGGPTDFGVGGRPSAIAAGDVNGDGRLDLVLPDSTLTVLLGRDDRSFDYVRSAAPAYGRSVAIGDLDGDRIPDLALALNGVQVMLGNGDGTFRPDLDYGMQSGPGAIAIGDFDPDDRLDLAGNGDVLLNTSHGPPTATMLVLFEAAWTSSGVEVRWSFTPGAGVASTQLQRAPAPGGPWSAVPAESGPPGDAVRMLDRGADPGSVTYYRLIARLLAGGTATFGPIETSASEFALRPVSPNPTSGAARLAYSIASETHVRLDIVDVQGRNVATLVDAAEPAGRHVAAWDGAAAGRPLPPGLYLARLDAGGRRSARRFVLTR